MRSDTRHGGALRVSALSNEPNQQANPEGGEPSQGVWGQ
jgi:hypothetical protein